MWLMDHPLVVVTLVVLLCIAFVWCVVVLLEDVIRKYEDELSALDDDEWVR